MTKLLLGLLCFIPVSAFAQNPCIGPITDLNRNPTKIALTQGEFTATWPDGTQRVVSVEMAYRKQADPASATPVATVTIPKAQFTLQAGTTDCMVATFAAPSQLQVGQTYTPYARTMGSGNTFSSATAGNPFFLDGAPSAPGAIRMVRAVFDTLRNRSRVLAARFFGSSQSSSPRAGR